MWSICHTTRGRAMGPTPAGSTWWLRHRDHRVIKHYWGPSGLNHHLDHDNFSRRGALHTHYIKWFFEMASLHFSSGHRQEITTSDRLRIYKKSRGVFFWCVDPFYKPNACRTTSPLSSSSRTMSVTSLTSPVLALYLYLGLVLCTTSSESASTCTSS